MCVCQAATGTVARLSVKVRDLRAYDISPAAVAIVSEARQARQNAPGDAHAFVRHNGQPWTANALGKRFARAARGILTRAGVAP